MNGLRTRGMFDINCDPAWDHVLGLVCAPLSVRGGDLGVSARLWGRAAKPVQSLSVRNATRLGFEIGFDRAGPPSTCSSSGLPHRGVRDGTMPRGVREGTRGPAREGCRSERRPSRFSGKARRTGTPRRRLRDTSAQVEDLIRPPQVRCQDDARPDRRGAADGPRSPKNISRSMCCRVSISV